MLLPKIGSSSQHWRAQVEADLHDLEAYNQACDMDDEETELRLVLTGLRSFLWPLDVQAQPEHLRGSTFRSCWPETKVLESLRGFLWPKRKRVRHELARRRQIRRQAPAPQGRAPRYDEIFFEALRQIDEELGS